MRPSDGQIRRDVETGLLGKADRILTEGISHLAADPRRRMFGEEPLWYYKRGSARAALGRRADAEKDLRTAIGLPGRAWVRGRSHLELGKLMLKASNREAANAELRQAVKLCEIDNDRPFAAEARRLIK